MHIVNEDLSVLDAAPAVLKVQGSGTDGLDLCAEQFNAGLEFLFHKVIVVCLAVLGRDLDSSFFRTAPLLC